jgi:hypothetical protein
MAETRAVAGGLEGPGGLRPADESRPTPPRIGFREADPKGEIGQGPWGFVFDGRRVVASGTGSEGWNGTSA